MNDISEGAGIPPGRMVGFTSAISLGLKNYVNFQGRSSRGAYWYWSLALLLLSFGAALLDMMLFYDMFMATDGSGPIGLFLSVATIIPGISLSVRRLHDIGRSGWWNLIAFTIIGIIPLIY